MLIDMWGNPANHNWRFEDGRWYAGTMPRPYVRLAYIARDGTPSWGWRENVARLHDSILNCSFYLYRSEEDARRGKNQGGTAFYYCVEVEGTDDMLLMYAVTAGHVVNQGFTTARVNLKSGGVHTFDITADSWQLPDNGVDVAVAPMRAEYRIHDIVCMPLPLGLSLSRERCQKENYGIGDPVFMVGRLRHHEGRLMNTPSVRFGHIAMMPIEKVRNDLGFDQESFLVEMHSIAGYSGSPVFVYKDDPFGSTSRILGIDWGHLPGSEKDSNAGIACVTPSWLLNDFLYREDMVQQRREFYEKNQEALEEKVGAVLDVSDDGEMSREEFLDALDRATDPIEKTDGD